MAWQRQDDCYATQGDWTMVRGAMGGEDRFTLWLIGKAPATSARPDRTRMIPIIFTTAAAASVWAKWAEDNSRDRIEAKAVRKELTPEQMEII